MRIKELDAFRGIAAVAVMIYHYTTRYDACYSSAVTPFGLKYGWLGVPFFFILSGFVITLTIERCKSPKEFLAKRILRLYPTYWICIIITLASIYLLGMQEWSRDFDKPLIDIIMNFTMFHRYLNFDNIDGAYWSLLPELLFYILMAVLFWIKKHKDIVVYNSVLIALATIHYFLPLPIIGKSLAIHYILLFMIGIHFYYMYYGQQRWYQHVFILINLVVGVFLYQIAQPNNEILFLLISFSIIVLMFYLFVFKKLKIFGNSKLLVFLGTISYALYLIHQTIGYGIMYYLDDWISNRSLSVIITSGVAIFLASGITFYIEPVFRPLLKKVLKIK